MRKHLRTLTEIGVLERRRVNDFPGSVDYGLTAAGQELLGVAAVLRAWLAAAPEGPLDLGTPTAKSVTKSLVDGWSSTMIRALAARPLSLTELSRLITNLNYPSLERRLGAMRLAGQIEACPIQGKGRPYRPTDWLRHGIAPLAAAARWERQHLPAEAAPITPMDAEAAFLLVVPMLNLPADLSGVCRLVVEVRSAGTHRLAGVLVTVQEGRIVSCVSRLEGDASAWASGSVGAWLSAVIDHDVERLEVGGDCSLASALVEGLHGILSAVSEIR
jgi:DNA-binding HxlR family transcriptional regulator